MDPSSADVRHARECTERAIVGRLLEPEELRASTFLLAGSRSTGSSDAHSDFDFYVIVHDRAYPRIYERACRSGLIDRGESLIWRSASPEITTKFLAERGLRHHLEQEPVHFLFLFASAVVLNDPEGEFRRIVSEYRGRFDARLPELIWLRFKDLLKAKHWLAKYAVRDVDASFDVIKQTAIRSAYEICFLMERRPFPYGKWLDYWCSRSTALGRVIRDRLVSLHRVFDKAEMASECAWLYDTVRDALLACGLDLPFARDPFRYMASAEGIGPAGSAASTRVP